MLRPAGTEKVRQWNFASPVHAVKVGTSAFRFIRPSPFDEKLKKYFKRTVTTVTTVIQKAEKQDEAITVVTVVTVDSNSRVFGGDVQNGFPSNKVVYID